MTGRQIVWQSLAKGVWKATIGNNKAKTLLDYVEASPRIDIINQMSDTAFPFVDEVKWYYVKEKTVLCFPLEDSEQLYGGGLNFKTSVINHSVLHLKADHYGGSDNGRTHAPVPFYVSTKGYGVFVNTPEYVDLYCGNANRVDSKKGLRNIDRNINPDWVSEITGEYVEACINNREPLEIVVFSGSNMLEVVERYNLYCGGGFIPPKWGLGIWKRVPTLASAEDILENIKEFKQKGFPIDVVGLEPGWQSCSYPCSYEWDGQRFKNPAKFINDALSEGVRINLWENPYISPESGIFDDMLAYSGTHTVWSGIVPDYTMKEAQDILKQQHEKDHADIGVSGYKLDECDGNDSWLWPDHAEFPSGTSAEQLRNTYGLLLQKITSDIFRKKNKRTYGLVRATNAGGNSLPYVLYNDCYDFEEFFTGLCNSGFIGAMWVPEVRNAETADEWLKRCQLVCFSPMAMINAWADATEPWTFEEVADKVKEVFILRKKLVPYFYNAFYEYAFRGTPPFRSLVMDYGLLAKERKTEFDGTDNPYSSVELESITDQFMAGRNLLVAPFSPSQHQRNIVLPNGNWYDFYTGEYAGNNEIISRTDADSNIPVYVNDGGIIPSQLSDKHMEIRYYGQADGYFELYNDDGETYDYEKGDYYKTKIWVKRHSNGNAKLSVEDNKDNYEFTLKVMTV